MHRLTATDTPMVRYTRTIFPSYANSVHGGVAKNAPHNISIGHEVIYKKLIIKPSLPCEFVLYYNLTPFKS